MTCRCPLAGALLEAQAMHLYALRSAGALRFSPRTVSTPPRRVPAPSVCSLPGAEGSLLHAGRPMLGAPATLSPQTMAPRHREVLSFVKSHSLYVQEWNSSPGGLVPHHYTPLPQLRRHNAPISQRSSEGSVEIYFLLYDFFGPRSLPQTI